MLYGAQILRVIAILFLFQSLPLSGENIPLPQNPFYPFVAASSDLQFQKLKEKISLTLKNSWCSETKINLMMDVIYQIKPQVCVEIGVFTGSSLLPVAATLKYLRLGKVYGIDAWSNEEAVKYMPPQDANYTWWSKVDMLAAKKASFNLIRLWKMNPYCTLIHAPSEMGVNYVPNKIDFLHLDGNFGEAGTLLDVQLFLPKVRSGGYILLSNLYQQLDGQFTKMAAMWTLFDTCEIIWNEDHNIALFRKN
ncbi:MAG TPA: class I SAM-dependent methyltransferase [Rhabdochlamydiaceae bacterium]|jgi:hypothetical protein|nr:class I SAM-dependent methyltransferase [Rhabdochlamydiaceae bacterium]